MHGDFGDSGLSCLIDCIQKKQQIQEKPAFLWRRYTAYSRNTWLPDTG
jgi:hypothetical protein